MPDSDKPDPLEGLAARIAEARGRRQVRTEGGGNRDESTGRFMSMAMRIGVELVAALVVAMGAGWLLDTSGRTKRGGNESDQQRRA